ncbi:Probable RNA polymerase sigma factor fecI [Serratia liquefaciens]|uniref:sigma-70 family RNA polymerase sigma factor n=1 Tax=Serratia liquefaciens TaxID=614 RepID=UPI0021833634|nr:sigma-70 family RNA polymerase sigma factor [Serratia liquefaciens]CAI2538381.1 Probable RNA polymerase sigma factor fecI [Serratia liquefaciens]
MSSAGFSSAENIEQLFSEHNNWLQKLLKRRLGNTNDASDLAQDVFLRLLIKPRNFDTLTGARAYLGSMAHGMCIDLWRRKEIERAWLETLAAQPLSTAVSAEHCAIVLETLFQVSAMLQALPEKVRTAFLMSQIGGQTYAKIAVELTISERMVKKYMAQAMLHCLSLEVEYLDALPATVISSDEQ